MSKLYYVGPRVEISNHGIFYKKSKEDKYVYLIEALEILKDIDNDYTKKSSYSHRFESKKLEENHLHSVLKHHDSDFDTTLSNECDKYKEKIENKIDAIQSIPHLTHIDKEVWIKNIEIMKEYKIQRAINKMYYMHCIHHIAQLIRHKKIKEISTPLSKNFFHVLNTLKGSLITGKPSLDAKIVEEYNKDNIVVLKLTMRN